MSVIDTAIVSNASSALRGPVRGSDGTLYAVVEETSNEVSVNTSTDGGLTWAQTTYATGFTVTAVASAISSDDVIHIIIAGNSIVYYISYSNGTFGNIQTIQDGTATSDGVASVDIAVDSTDTPHAVWSQDGPIGTSSTSNEIFYSKRTSGTWASPTTLSSTNDDMVSIAIDSQDRIHVIFMDGAANVSYVTYDGSWSSPIEIMGNTYDGIPLMVIDSSDNIWVFALETTGTDEIEYVKYTESTQLWSAETAITTTTPPGINDGVFSVSIDASDNIYIVYSNPSSDNDLYIVIYTGSWSAEAKIIDGDATNDYGFPLLGSCIYPILNGEHTNIPDTGYHLVYKNSFTSGYRYHASTDLTFPDPQTKSYSRKPSASLPTDDTGLTNLYTATEYGNVAVDDAIYTDQTATDQYAIHQFKNKADNSTDEIHVTWIGKTNIAPSTSTVYLQIYNRNSSTWETLDSDSATSAGVNFTLTGSKTTNLSNYYNGSNWVSCRVYQLAQ